MSGLGRSLLLGVDAGGTKTTAMITRGGGAESVELGRGDSGPGNPNRADSLTAFGNVLTAMRLATEQADVTFAEIASAVVGMAGAGTAAIQMEAANYLRQKTQLANLRVIPDFQLVRPAAFSGDGIAIIAGTGSIVHGVRGQIETRVGGHGHLVDDCGSGYWIGRQALRAIVYNVDGRGPATALTTVIGQSFQQTDPSKLVATMQAAPQRLNKISSIASLVVATAIEKDAVAISILDRAATELSSMISAACDTLGYPPDTYPLALAGSVLTKTQIVREKLLAALRRQGRAPQTVKIVDEPVLGAILLAAAE